MSFQDVTEHASNNAEAEVIISDDVHPVSRGFKSPILYTALLIFLGLLGVVASFPIQIYGDGSGYLGIAASLIKDHNLAFDEQDTLYTAQWGDPETLMPYSKEGYLTRPNRNGVVVWGTHSFYYPLLITPFLMLFGVKGAVLLNIALFAGVFTLLAKALGEAANSTAAGIGVSLALLLFTPLLSYVFWIHTEIALLFAVFAAFYALYGGRPVVGAAFLGWAAAQKPPLILVFGLFVLWLFLHDRAYRKIIYAGLAMGIAMAPQLVYNLWSFGSLSSFGSYVDPGLVSTERLFTFWLGPARGMIWFFPLLLWCLIRSSKPWWWTLACAVVALVLSAGSSVITVFYGHEVGIRYGVYIYPLFLALLPLCKFRWPDFGALAVAVFLTGGLLINPLGNLANWHVYPNTYPSRLLVGAGLPLYPETVLRVDGRMARDISADYVDSEQRPRKKTVHIMAKRLHDPELIVKLYGEPVGDLSMDATVSLQIPGEKAVTRPLTFGRVSTLYASTAPENMGITTLPNFEPFDGSGDHAISILRATLSTPLYIAREGNARLRWTQLSRPDDPMAKSYVYQMGPYIVGIYPGRSWIVGTIASEELESFGLSDNAFNRMIPGGTTGSVELIEEKAIEGSSYLRLQVSNQDSQQPLHFLTEPVNLDLTTGFEPKLEFSGWYRSEGLALWTLTAVFDDGSATPKEVLVGQAGPSPAWGGQFQSLIDVPAGATRIRLRVSTHGASGYLDLDDLIVSKWRDPWH